MKQKRQEAIVNLINNNSIETQEELLSLLTKSGINTTQATVSRDIRELKLIKVNSGSKQKYVAISKGEPVMQEKYNRILKDGFVSVDMAQNILVIKTVSGMAMAVAAALDAMEFNEIVGTIAGDDTIMCAVRTVEDTRLLLEKIRKRVI